MPTLSTARSLNVATPLSAVTVVAPRNAAPLVPVPGVIASVTPVLESLVTVLPKVSCTVT